MSKQVQLLHFVVHKHHATSLHYDFRIQIGEVMPSWSIPKGPSLDNSLKRLAIPTTDHSLEYNDFEGVIPEGQYGAGPVMIWDEGHLWPEIEIERGVRKEIQDYSEAQKVLHDEYKKGELKFQLYGKKLKGSFALVKTRGFGTMKNAWLLIKHDDKFAQKGYDAKDYDFSARTGKSIVEIEKSV